MSQEAQAAILSNQGKDYAGGVIDTPEALAVYLNTDPTAPAGKKAVDADTSEDEGKEGAQGQQGKKDQGQGAEAQGTNEGEEDNEEGNEEEHPTILHFLDDKFGLKLNLEGLPSELDRNQEAEAIAAVFERAQQGYANIIQQYQHVDNALKDPEVKAFIQAKLQGKTLKDYVGEFSVSAQGLPQEQAVTKYLKSVNPAASDEDIKDMVAVWKEKGKLEKLEADARKYFQTEEAKGVQLKEQREREEATQSAETRRQEAIKFAQYLKGVKDVSGVPLTDKMRHEVFSAATSIVDQNSGSTWLDRALQTDEGIFYATLGILHMRNMLKGKNTLEVNRSKQKFTDSLFETPDQLQSSSESRGKGIKEVDASIANSF